VAIPKRFRNYVDDTTIKLHPVTGAAFAVPINDVSSVFGRTGDVVATLDDYVAGLVGNDSLVPGATVKDALDALFGVIGSGETVHKVPFDHTDIFPLVLSAMAVGSVVDSAVLAVVTPFDPGVRAKLGTPLDNSRIFDVPLDAATTTQYGDESLNIFDVPDLLELFVGPSAVGAGLLLYKVVA
jgi:hypothetical protein